MIRDPSDGSVRIHSEPLQTKDNLQKEPGFGSGLPMESKKPEQIARIEKSRIWLKNYRLGQQPPSGGEAIAGDDQRAEDDA